MKYFSYSKARTVSSELCDEKILYLCAQFTVYYIKNIKNYSKLRKILKTKIIILIITNIFP